MPLPGMRLVLVTLLLLAGCNTDLYGSIPGCEAGVDSDGDGVTNDVECDRGLDPQRADTDGDGISDGAELAYPKICIAEDRGNQRRPPAPCSADAGCQPGERCLGLDPTRADSDGDGLPDRQEDAGLDGDIALTKGETDPRLYDTIGDGHSDSMRGLEICKPEGLATVTQVAVPMGAIQLGHDPAWGKARAVPGTKDRGALLVDDPAANVAGAVFSLPATRTLNDESRQIEDDLRRALGATPAIRGSLTTHELNPAATATLRIVKNTTAGALRDLGVMPLVGAAAPAGPAYPAAGEFLLDVVTVLRAAEKRLDVVITVAPRTESQDTARITAIRALDLVNATGVAQEGKQPGSACQAFRAERAALVDFLWTVDTSPSMNGDQARLGNTATRFFDRLAAAGVDFRVGVTEAGSGELDLDTPGLRWISGSDPMGPLKLCRTVTEGDCPTGGPESDAPYPFKSSASPTMREEPVAAAVIGHNLLLKRSLAGEANPDRRFRTGARVVSFMATDEAGSNDYRRYFQDQSDPQINRPWGATWSDAALKNIIDYFKRNSILTFGLVPVSNNDPCVPPPSLAALPRCVIEGNGGATIPITTALDAEIAVAMDRIVDAVAGATSQFRLLRSPITSTIQVRVRGMIVPRSRREGFDYDPGSRSVVFYGSQFRPQTGDNVVISYRVWEGSLG